MISFADEKAKGEKEGGSKMAESRLIGSYPAIGIRPTIDGRRGALDVERFFGRTDNEHGAVSSKTFQRKFKSILTENR